ncbi:putative conjugal transfer protein TraG (plasmid) [Campylobacter iguaniorum]|uniref:Putative conjugal transfer protein TraG n=1 Tax=Campylobacter iguaniorum TaxID=1244531 RepID=A0A076FI52_9BACT|nr:conjugal transfer protein TraH [Campylobacter iguaniorum]AII15529.1 putative conjugal transfer protein TraG [Campylobacter iguaniorum]
MVNLKKITALFLAATISLSTPATANLTSFIQNNLDTSITTENAGYYKTQSRGYYTLGSARVRWGGLGTVHPFNMQAPSINVGCSGIDMVFGGFSYLNFEYLVEKLKKISAAAPAFAFKMALSTLCKDCDTIMTELEKIANAINNMNFDTCKMSQQIGSWAGAKIGNMASDALKFGGSESWLSSHTKAIEDTSSTIQGWINGANSWMNGGAEGAKENLLQGSLVKRATDTYGTIFGNGAEWEALTRSMVGDVVGYTKEKTKSDGSKETDIKVEIIHPEMDYVKFIEILLEGGTVDAVGFSQTESGGMKMKPTYPTTQITIPTGGMKKMVEDKIIAIVNKINANEALSISDKNFINSMPVPVYRIINVISVLGDTGVEKTAEYIALKQIDALIRKLTDEMTRYLAVYKRQKGADVLSDKDMEKVDQLVFTARQNRQQINDIMVGVAADFNKQVDLVNYYMDLEKNIRQKSPLWTAASFGG